DRLGRKPLYLSGAVITTLWAFPLFGLMNTASPLLIVLAFVIGVNLGHDLMYGPQAAYFAELFGTRVRYSGASLGYQLASVFAGARGADGRLVRRGRRVRRRRRVRRLRGHRRRLLDRHREGVGPDRHARRRDHGVRQPPGRGGAQAAVPAEAAAGDPDHVRLR